MNLLSRGHREQPFLRLFVFISFLSIGEVAVAQPEPVSGSGEKSLAEDTERAIERGCEFLRRSLAKGPIGSASSPYSPRLASPLLLRSPRIGDRIPMTR